MRLSKCSEDIRLFQDHMMGIRQNTRTSDNLFVLKTPIDKQFHKNEKLYCCFVDLSEASDTVWRRSFLAKFTTFGTHGKMLSIIEHLYPYTNGLAQGGLPIKSDGGGVRMLRVPNFLKNYTAGCANLQTIILLGALFL